MAKFEILFEEVAGHKRGDVVDGATLGDTDYLESIGAIRGTRKDVTPMFEVGDVVMASPDGPKMTIQKIDGQTVEVQWFEGDDLKTGSFDLEQLRPAGEDVPLEEDAPIKKAKAKRIGP